jgi:hypothetical protein
VEKRQVDYNEAKAIAERLGLKYVETSAKDATGVNEAFMDLTKDVLKVR